MNYLLMHKLHYSFSPILASLSWTVEEKEGITLVNYTLLLISPEIKH